ncbi:MAG: carboxypeptidase regulatory-like domain-containing protein [Bryobacteraceae bacterium]
MGTRTRRVVILTAIVVAVCILAVILIVRTRQSSVTLTGVVLREDPDPQKQLPIQDVKITATAGERSVQAETDASGLFRLKLPNGGWREQPVALAFVHPGYQPLEITPNMSGELYIVRMTPMPSHAAAPVGVHEIAIKDVRVRYAEKTSNTVDVGSAAKTFIVPNTGNVPCGDEPPCSPDGQWKASMGNITMDAGQGEQFDNARVSCIAGPCPFTRIETGAIPRPGRTIKVTIRNWSDTVTFLVEAEVTRSMPSDAIRQAYPAIYGRALSFTLPATAEGPSLEVDVGGSEIVFPLGPALQLSWADCTLQVGADQTKLYLCELKPGYQFQ